MVRHRFRKPAGAIPYRFESCTLRQMKLSRKGYNLTADSQFRELKKIAEYPFGVLKNKKNGIIYGGWRGLNF